MPLERSGSDLRLKDTNKMWPRKQQTRWRSKTNAVLTCTEEEIEIVLFVCDLAYALDIFVQHASL